jgi:ABC-2 type transport system permease protein
VRGLLAAAWAETLKARRSRVAPMTAGAYLLFPLFDALFMWILEDPERARSMGLIGAKAEMVAGSADWPTFFQVLLLGIAIGGAVLGSFIIAWIFGREFSDHTSKELLALPTRRDSIITAKFALAAIWMLSLSMLAFAVGVAIGAALHLPGGSTALAATSFKAYAWIVVLTALLMPVVAVFASVGGGYLPPLAWAFLVLALAQIATVLGWADWFPWAVPGLLAGSPGSPPAPLAPHSLLVVLATSIVGAAVTYAWWRRADHTR